MNSVFILGKMEECMKDSIRMIKSMDMVFTHGQIKRSMLDGGSVGNSMV